jgi:hypothetical protein
MKWVLWMIAMLIASAVAEDELKVYGIVTYLAQDNRSLRLGDIDVVLSDSEIEGVLTVGSLVKVEGFWQDQILYAEEVEVEHPQTEVLIYQGQVQGGKLLGLEFPGLSEGEWLEVVTERGETKLNILLIKPVTVQQSRLQATVETLDMDGFTAGGVSVISAQDVSVGQRVTVTGAWNGRALVANVSAKP